MDWSDVIGTDPAELCDGVYGARPSWAVGCVSRYDAQFLFISALEAKTDLVVEIGTAAGVSTAVLCFALSASSHAGVVRQAFTVATYDVTHTFYADKSKAVGDAAREMLEPELLEHITFRNPATAITLREEHEPDSIAFMFIDANHRHPWPTLDMLAALPAMRPGGEVALHDINLPLLNQEWSVWGAKYVFDELDTEKRADEASPRPNIGSIRVPPDKAALRRQLIDILYRHEWETEVREDVVQRVLA